MGLSMGLAAQLLTLLSDPLLLGFDIGAVA